MILRWIEAIVGQMALVAGGRARGGREQSVRTRARVRSTSLSLSGGWLSASAALNSLTYTPHGPFSLFLTSMPRREICLRDQFTRNFSDIDNYVTFWLSEWYSRDQTRRNRTPKKWNLKIFFWKFLPTTLRSWFQTIAKVSCSLFSIFDSNGYWLKYWICLCYIFREEEIGFSYTRAFRAVDYGFHFWFQGTPPAAHLRCWILQVRSSTSNSSSKKKMGKRFTKVLQLKKQWLTTSA